MKTKKHKTGYKYGDPIIRNGIQDPFGPKPRPSGGKPPILWVKKDGKLVKATKTEVAKAHKVYIKGPHGKSIPKRTIKVGSKYVKKGGKV